MTAFAALIWREWLEHKGAFTWAPGVVLGLLLLVAVSAVLMDGRMEMELSEVERQELNERLSERLNGEAGDDEGVMSALAAMSLDVAGSTDAELAGKLQLMQQGIAGPFLITFGIVAFFALLGAIYDERKDRSVLFWKSLPVSDTQSVMSKVVFVLWAAPVVTMVAVFVAQFVAILLTSIYVEDGMGGRVWAQSGIWLRPFGLVVEYVTFGLWAVPLAGWIILVSSFVTKMPALFALGLPWIVGMVERLLLGQSTIGALVGAHFRLLRDVHGHGGVLSPLALFAEPGFLLGLVVGAGFIAGAIYFRRRNNDI